METKKGKKELCFFLFYRRVVSRDQQLIMNRTDSKLDLDLLSKLLDMTKFSGVSCLRMVYFSNYLTCTCT